MRGLAPPGKRRSEMRQSASSRHRLRFTRPSTRHEAGQCEADVGSGAHGPCGPERRSLRAVHEWWVRSHAVAVGVIRASGANRMKCSCSGRGAAINSPSP